MTWNEPESTRVWNLEQRVEQLERKAKDGTWWLIECGSPTTYFCADGDWCSNPNHAHRFATKEEAQQKAHGMTTMEPVRVCDHQWG